MRLPLALAALLLLETFLGPLGPVDSGPISGSILAAPALAGADDTKALEELRNFLFDVTARKNFASQNPAAKNAEQDLSRYSPEIQREILEIVMLIMQETRGNPGASSMNAGNPQAAMNSFSPAVQARIKSLASKIAAQPKK